ncbi:MAG: helix-turn-helix transcriptional regulator [Chitinophagaceae bacterium]|nr:helix-turn-helix transcriptional regulator [Chitinophagaceae bacterium]
MYIRNMVSVRCKMAVRTVLEKLKIDYLSIELGYVSFPSELTSDKLTEFGAALKQYELELMSERKKNVVDRIKILIIGMFHSPNVENPGKLSEYLSKKLNLEYTYLANVYSETEGSTIEKFYILTKIERVKQMLVSEGLTIKEIYFKLNYSSESHLCQQFKKVTGLTPSMYKNALETEAVTSGE